MTQRYFSGRSSSDLSHEDSGTSADTLLKIISIDSHITSGPLPYCVSGGGVDGEDPGERVVFLRNNTYIDDSCADLEDDPGTDSGENSNEDIDTRRIFEDIKKNYSEEVLSLSKDIDIEESIDHLSEGTTTKEKNQSCATCYKEIIVENVSWLEKGQHIKLRGAHLTFRFRSENKSVYYHHAIVKRIIKTSENSVELVLIHFSKVDKEIRIIEQTITYNLEKDDIYIIKYERPRYDKETIVQRAESMVHNESEAEENKQFGSYNLFCCNCEHFASWCVVGEGESFQAQGVFKSSAKILSKAAGSGCKIGRFIKRFLHSASTKIFSRFDFGKFLPGMLLGATAIIYLIYTVAMTIAYRIKLTKGKICKVCFKREVVAMWTNFGTFGITSGITYLLVHFLFPLLTPTPAIPMLLILMFLSIFLQWGIGKLVKALRSPYACDKMAIKDISQVTPGTMISFKYFRIPHFAIVTEKHAEGPDSQKGTITCVHYGLKGFNIFGTREVIEESFELDVKNVKLIDCRQLKTFPPDVVVKRVRARIGEKTWKPFSNRSDHLCFDTIVQEERDHDNHAAKSNTIDESDSKHKSSFYHGKKEIHLRGDLHIGNIVKYKGLIGIVVRLVDLDEATESGEQNFKMDLIVYRDSRVFREKFTVDLKRESLLIMKYNPAHCCPMEERAQRARQREGELSEFRTEKDFLESGVLKKL